MSKRIKKESIKQEMTYNELEFPVPCRMNRYVWEANYQKWGFDVTTPTNMNRPHAPKWILYSHKLIASNCITDSNECEVWVRHRNTRSTSPTGVNIYKPTTNSFINPVISLLSDSDDCNMRNYSESHSKKKKKSKKQKKKKKRKKDKHRQKYIESSYNEETSSSNISDYNCEVNEHILAIEVKKMQFDDFIKEKPVHAHYIATKMISNSELTVKFSTLMRSERITMSLENIIVCIFFIKNN